MKKLVDDEKMNQLLFEDLIHLEDIQIERFTNELKHQMDERFIFFALYDTDVLLRFFKNNNFNIR